MDFEIIKLPKGKSAVLGKIVQDDLVSRQTIVVRDMVSLNLEGEDTLVLIEGSKEALEKAMEIVGDEGTSLSGEEKQKIHKIIMDAEENVAEGLGLMFG
ncbi:MAG: hypothetical protein ACMUHB_00175 [Thermoplasmatota archaeon]